MGADHNILNSEFQFEAQNGGQGQSAIAFNSPAEHTLRLAELRLTVEELGLAVAELGLTVEELRLTLDEIGLTRTEHSFSPKRHSLMSAGHAQTTAGHILTSTGNTLTPAGHSFTLTGHSFTLTGHTLAPPGHILTSPRRSLTPPGHRFRPCAAGDMFYTEPAHTPAGHNVTPKQSGVSGLQKLYDVCRILADRNRGVTKCRTGSVSISHIPKCSRILDLTLAIAKARAISGLRIFTWLPDRFATRTIRRPSALAPSAGLVRWGTIPCTADALRQEPRPAGHSITAAVRNFTPAGQARTTHRNVWRSQKLSTRHFRYRENFQRMIHGAIRRRTQALRSDKSRPQAATHNTHASAP